jgi:predicted porin
MYNVSKSVSDSKAKVATLGAIYDFGGVAFKAGWGQADVDGIKKERLISVGAVYSLSKRTYLYADAASKRFPTEGSKSAYGVGITHSF